MAGSIYDWSTTPATNATADAAINWAEFQDPDTVNNSARQMMARHAEYRADTNATITSTGAANTYAVTLTSVPTTLVNGTIVYFVAHQSNSGAATLAVNSFGAKPIRARRSTALKNGEIQANTVIGAYYSSTGDEWLILNSGVHVNALGPAILSSSTFGIKVGDVKLSLSTSPDAGFIRLTEAAQALNKSAYPDLNTWAQAQGYPWGSTSTTFNVPPAGGYFLRFSSTNATVDPQGPRTAAGNTQTDALGSHTHPFTTSTDGAHTHNYNIQPDALHPTGTGATEPRGTFNVPTPTSSAGSHNHTGTTDPNTGFANETRARNVIMHADMLAVPALVASGLIGAAGLAYKFSSTVAVTDPGSGYLGINNAAPASATVLSMSETDANGGAMAGLLGSLTPNSIFHIVKVGDPSTFMSFTLASTATDNGSWENWTVTYRAAGDALAANDYVSVVVMPAGPTATVATYTVASLPALSAGSIAYASNGRKNGEGVGSGTGVLVFRDGTAWRACDTGATVAA